MASGGANIPIFSLNGGINYGTDDPGRQHIISFQSMDRLSEVNSSTHSSTDNVTSNNRDWFSRVFERMFVRGEGRKTLIPDETPDNPRRTLSWVSGVVAPVALGMFSTMLFIRIGKSRQS